MHKHELWKYVQKNNLTIALSINSTCNSINQQTSLIGRIYFVNFIDIYFLFFLQAFTSHLNMVVSIVFATYITKNNHPEKTYRSYPRNSKMFRDHTKGKGIYWKRQ